MDVAMAHRFRAVAILSSLLLGACAGNNTAEVSYAPEAPKELCASTAVPNQFLVRWKDGSISVEKAADRDDFIKTMEPYKDEIEFSEHDQVIQIDKPTSPDVSIAATSANLSSPTWGQQAVAAPDVWAKGVLGEGVVVAVVDSGVDLTHPQIRPRLYTNPNEIKNGVDDDGNGLVDDIHGYDFAGETGDVRDMTGHGTHVAGIIGADHSTGDVKGMAPKAKILPLNFMDSQGRGDLSNAIRAMVYAASQGARVINASWGGATSCSKNLRNTIIDLQNKGVLFVTASGNGDSRGNGINLDEWPEYPAAYGLSGQITVGASTDLHAMAKFSNYSKNVVNLLAPGVTIYSTYPDNSTYWMSGTSMATPFVSGAAALLISAHPEATVNALREAILNTVDLGNFPVSTSGRLNVKKALQYLANPTP